MSATELRPHACLRCYVSAGIGLALLLAPSLFGARALRRRRGGKGA